MAKKSDKTILILDDGSCTFVAEYLSRSFTTVRYFSRWACFFPTMGAQKIGDGIDGVEKVLSWEDHIEDTDIFIFTGIYFRETANLLRSMGKNVWGSGNMESFERDRALFMDILKEAGLPIPKTTEVKGLDALHKYLDGKKDVWVKTSEFRGMQETWRFVDARFTEFIFLELELLFGIYKNDITLFVQEPIEGIEYGMDPVVTKCGLSTNMPVGVEFKDKMYFMRFDEFKNIPKEAQEIYTKFFDEVKKTDAKDYSGNASSEIRVDKEGVNYFTDYTPRTPQPAGASMLYGSDFAQVLLDVMDGKVATFKPRYKYVIESVMYSHCKEKWNPIYFDDKYKEQIFLSSYAVQDGFTYRVPVIQTSESFANITGPVCLGSVCGGGSTPQEALDQLNEALCSIEALDLVINKPTIQDIEKTIEEVYENTGYKF